MTYWWKDPVVVNHLVAIYARLAYLLLGVFGWEYFTSFGVEYAVLRGRIPLRWPLVPYVLGRIFLLTSLVLLTIETTTFSRNWACQPAITWITILWDIAIGTSSTNLMIRSWVMWKNSHWVHTLLSLLALGHWVVMFIDAVNIKAFRSNGCILYIMHPAASAGIFLYTAFYDLVVLVLTIVKLSIQPTISPLEERLRTQGLYFAIATLANIPPTVFAFLGADIMLGITANIATTVSIIVSCRAVRTLLNLRTSSTCHTLDGNDDNVVLTTQLPYQASIWTSADDLQGEPTASGTACRSV